MGRGCGCRWSQRPGGNLGDDLSDSKSLSGGVGKAASQSVVLNGVMSWGSDKVGGCIAHNSASWGHSQGASTGKGDERGERQEGEGLVY